MTKAARAASVALGRDMSDAMDRLTRGIVKAEPEILDELGIIFRLDVVYKKFAKSINKTTAELTEMEKLTARNASAVGQLESKFGDIAETIPANAFKQLSTSVMDLAMAGAGSIASGLAPLVRVLADSEALLISVMALIGRSLMQKMFPFFTSLGDKIDKFAAGLGRLTKRLKAFNATQMKKGGADALSKLKTDRVAQEAELRTQLKSMGLDNGKLGGKAFVKAVKAGIMGTGKQFGVNIIKGLNLATKASLGKIDRGEATKGTVGMAGVSKKDLRLLDNILSRLTKTIGGIGQATKGNFSLEMLSMMKKIQLGAAAMGEGLAKGFQNFINGTRLASQVIERSGFFKGAFGMMTSSGISGLIKDEEGKISKANTKLETYTRGEEGMTQKQSAKFRADNRVAIDELNSQVEDASGLIKQLGMLQNSKIGKMGAALGSLFTGLSKGLSWMVGALGSIMMIKWVAEELLSWSKAANKAHKAVEELNGSMKTTITLLTKRRALGKSSKLNTAETLVGSLDFHKQKYNIAEGLQMAFEGAAGQIDIEAINNSWYASFIDALFGLVGNSIRDKLNDALAGALSSIAGALSPSEFDKFIVELDLENRLTKSFQASSSSSIGGEFASALFGGGVTTAGVMLSGLATAATAAAAEGTLATVTFGLLGVTVGATAVALVGVALAVTGVYISVRSSMNAWTMWGNSAEDAAETVITTLQKVNEGVLSPELAVEKLEGIFDLTRAEAVKMLEDIADAQKAAAEEAKKHRDILQDMIDNAKKLSTQQKDLVASIFPSSNLRDFSKTFEALIKNLEDGTQSASDKFMMLKEQGLFGDNNSALVTLINDEEYNKVLQLRKYFAEGGMDTGGLYKALQVTLSKSLIGKIELAKQAIASAEHSLDLIRKGQTGDGSAPTPERLDILKRRATQNKSEGQEALVQARSSIYDELIKGESELSLVTKMNHANATKMYEEELTRATEISFIKLKMSELDRLGTSAVKVKAKYEQMILEREKATLEANIKMGQLKGAEKDHAADRVRLLDLRIRQLGNTSEAVSKHLHKIFGTTYLLSEQINDKLNDSIFGNDSNFKKWKSDKITEELSKFKNALDEVFKDGQKVAFTLDMLKEKFGSLGEDAQKNLKGAFAKKFRLAFPGEKEYKNIAKWVRLATTAQGKLIVNRHEVLNKEMGHIAIQSESFLEHKDILDLRKKMADWDDKISDKALTREREMLKLKEIEAEISSTELDLKMAQWKEATDWLGEAMVGVADSFGDAISSAASDLFMNKKPDKEWKEQLKENLAQGFADSAGSIIGNLAQSTVFGNKGLLAEGARSMGVGEDLIEVMFPRTETQILVDKLEELRTMEEQVKDGIGLVVQATQAMSQGLGTGAGLDTRSRDLTTMLSGGWSEDIMFKGTRSTDKENKVTPFAMSEDKVKALWDKRVSEFVAGQKEVNSDLYNNPTKYLQDLEHFTLRFVKSIGGMNAFITNDKDIETTQIESVLHEVLHRSVVVPFEKMSDYFKSTGTGSGGGTGYAGFLTTLNVEGGDNPEKDYAGTYYTEREKKFSEGVSSGMKNVELAGLYRNDERSIEEFFVRLKTVYATLEKPETREEQVQLVKDLIPDYQESRMTPEFIKQLIESVVDKDTPKMVTSLLEGTNTEIGLLTKISNFLEGIFGKLGIDGISIGPNSIGVRLKTEEDSSISQDYKAGSGFGIKESTFEKGGFFFGTDSGTPLELLQRAVGEYFSTTGKIATVDFGGKNGTREFNYTPDMGLNRFNRQTYAAGVETNSTRVMDMGGNNGIDSELLKLLKKLNVLPQDAQQGQVLEMDVKDLVESLKVLMGDKLSQVIEKLPDTDSANSANTSLAGAADTDALNITNKSGDISNGINGKLNTGQDLAVSIAGDAKNTMKQGFQSVVTGGHMDAKGLAMSFVQRASGKLMGSIFDDIFGGIFGSANGNVIKGGFQAFAKGGLVTKPTLGLVGEGKYNEAVVPLPDGRSIPISGATGNTENNVTVNVTIDSDGNAKSDTNSGMDGDRAKQLGYMVSQAVQAELVDQKRPGGLLSQY
jgi:hypothetical protein